MTNSDLGSVIYEELLCAVADEYGWSGYGPAERAAVPVDQGVFEGYAGAYQLKPGFELTVAVSDGALTLLPSGQDVPLELQPLAEAEYFAGAVDAEVTFTRDERGGATGLVFKQNGRELTAPKLR